MGAPNGTENADAFGPSRRNQLIRKLALSLDIRWNKDARATRDVNMVLVQVRAARADNRTPRFDKVSLDLEGRGHEEGAISNFFRLMRNPTTINDQNSSFKSEPHLFLVARCYRPRGEWQQSFKNLRHMPLATTSRADLRMCSCLMEFLTF